MEDYRAGRYGDNHLTLHDIFEKAGEPELLAKMSLSEIQSLVDTSSGMLKKMFSLRPALHTGNLNMFL